MNKKQTIEQRWRNNQYNSFDKEWADKWQDCFPEKNDLKDKIIKLKYDNFYDVNNAFAKLNKALQICTFLHELSKLKPPQDTEKIIITTLVSCAEAVYRINKPNENINENLIKGFFKPVESSINYKIRGHVGDIPYKKTFRAIEILYLIRNDYIHNGNFTGKFFRNDNSENYAYNSGDFYFSEKENKVKLILAESECCLTYKEFKKIFLEAFIKSIENYCGKISISKTK